MKTFTTVCLSICLLALAACGGGGGGSTSPGGGGANPPVQPSVTGDMLSVAASRGWNYHGTLSGSPVTLTIYADPPSSGSTTLVALGVLGTQTNATAGAKIAAMTVTPSSGYQVTSYVLYNSDGSIYSQGALPNPQLIASTLVQGSTFTPYPGMTATVSLVGTVPGAGACPTPNATGSTVTYSFQGQNYQVSFVPGCGITQYVGNHGETFTLSSIGSYPGLGTLGNVRQMQSLTLWDTAKSAVHAMFAPVKWRSLFGRP